MKKLLHPAHLLLALLSLSLSVQAGTNMTFYVRPGGSGVQDGSSWSNAFDQIQDGFTAMSLGSERGQWVTGIVNVASTGAGESFSPAGHEGGIQNSTRVEVRAGFDPATDTQTGTSLIKGSGLTGSQTGVNLKRTSGDHYERLQLRVERVIIEDVSIGCQLQCKGLDNEKPIFELKNSQIAAGTHAVKIYYNSIFLSHGPTQVTIQDCALLAGQDPARTGDGLNTYSPYHRTTINNTTIHTPTGDGLHLSQLGYWQGHTYYNFYLHLRNSAITDCGGYGIYHKDMQTIEKWTAPQTLLLDKVVLTGNGNTGLYGYHNDKGTYWGNSNESRIYLYATNSVFSGNSGWGIDLSGHSTDNKTCGIVPTFVNCTISENTQGGFRSRTENLTGNNTHKIYNCIISGNTGSGVDINDGNSSGMTLSEEYNNLYANSGTNLVIHNNTLAPGGTDLAINPRFCRATEHPFQLKAGSPVRNAGSAAYAPVDDVLGEPRPDGSGDAMGAYETLSTLGGGSVLILGADNGGVTNDYDIGETEIAVAEYIAYLNSQTNNQLTLTNGQIRLADSSELLALTTDARSDAYISGDLGAFSPVTNRSDHPMIYVTWFGACTYCNWQSLQDGLTPVYQPASNWTAVAGNNGYRLPTEPEWYKAAAWDLATETYRTYGTDTDQITPSQANYLNSQDTFESNPIATTPVAIYSTSSPYGLVDASGNIWEWCHNFYQPGGADPALDPHPVRGGSWGNLVTDLKASTRSGFRPDQALNTVGFRIVSGQGAL